METVVLLLLMFMFMIVMVFTGSIILYVIIKPFIPYIVAKFTKRDILLLIGKDNRIRLIPAKYSSGIYNTSSPPYSFLHKVPRAYRFGDLQAVFVHDGWGVTLDPDYAEVIEELKRKGVTDYEELARRVYQKDEYGKDVVVDEEDKLSRDDIIRIHAFKDIDFGNFLSFVADMTPTEIRSHIDEYIAKFTEDQRHLAPSKEKNNTMIIIIILIIGLAVGGFFLMKYLPALGINFG